MACHIRIGCLHNYTSNGQMRLATTEGDEGGKVSCVAYAPKGAALAANDWLSAALAPCGGRGGGNANSAQGQAGASTELTTSLAAAEEFATAAALQGA